MKKNFEILEEGRLLDNNGMGLIIGGGCASLCRDVLTSCAATHTEYCGPSSSSLARYKNCVGGIKEICRRMYCSVYAISPEEPGDNGPITNP